jgi:hypothetical protein
MPVYEFVCKRLPEDIHQNPNDCPTREREDRLSRVRQRKRGAALVCFYLVTSRKAA